MGRALQVCPRPDCSHLVSRERSCPVHGTVVRDRRNTNTTARGYGYAWQVRRRAYLLEFPSCEQCGSPATQVDHKLPKVLGGTDDRGNLQSLCSPCHRLKSAEDGSRVLPS